MDTTAEAVGETAVDSLVVVMMAEGAGTTVGLQRFDAPQI